MSWFYIAVSASFLCTVSGMPAYCWAIFLGAAIIVGQIERSAKMLAARQSGDGEGGA